MTTSCPALLVTAPASGSGKTSVTAGLARYHARNGLRVRCFKTGPDFIDPTILAQASGEPVYNLDPWIMGVEHCRQLLFEAAQDSDLILVEGVMGLFDGSPSSADLAELFGLPLLLVVDASAMAQTFGAVVHGLATYRESLRVAGVIANRIGSDYHAQLLRESISPALQFAALQRDAALALPERHLGLQIAGEIGDLDARLDALADAMAATEFAQLPPDVIFEKAEEIDVPLLLDDVVIAVAFDAAFCFLYQANIEWLQRMGARLKIFSPLNDKQLPEADAVYLPGGYPELHAAELSDNEMMLNSICAHIDAGKPLLAECGGMLYLTSALIDFDGARHTLLDILPGVATMGEKLAALGSQQFSADHGITRGHTFHYSTLQSTLPPLAFAQTQRGEQGEAVYRISTATASYVHWYFPSNPEQIADWLLPK